MAAQRACSTAPGFAPRRCSFLRQTIQFEGDGLDRGGGADDDDDVILSGRRIVTAPGTPRMVELIEQGPLDHLEDHPEVEPHIESVKEAAVDQMAMTTARCVASCQPVPGRTGGETPGRTRTRGGGQRSCRLARNGMWAQICPGHLRVGGRVRRAAVGALVQPAAARAAAGRWRAGAAPLMGTVACMRDESMILHSMPNLLGVDSVLEAGRSMK
ncbi:unnamed protein product [Prorocentrum cordatum]|uniref:Uncharacterized protein n=1 Tax=Prorocentrum cordatum TaxID=2364126 RepID=A0ABN9WXW0_9DINO|nr:unnamed protein product [Polarella glacialis]